MGWGSDPDRWNKLSMKNPSKGFKGAFFFAGCRPRCVQGICADGSSWHFWLLNCWAAPICLEKNGQWMSVACCIGHRTRLRRKMGSDLWLSISASGTGPDPKYNQLQISLPAQECSCHRHSGVLLNKPGRWRSVSIRSWNPCNKDVDDSLNSWECPCPGSKSWFRVSTCLYHLSLSSLSHCLC